MTFEEWLRSASLHTESAAARSLMFHAWNAGQFNARKECEKICEMVADYWGFSGEPAEICRERIRATIPEE